MRQERPPNGPWPQYDELALAGYELMFGYRHVDGCEVDPDTGVVLSVLMIV